MPKTKGPSKTAQQRARVQACTVEVTKLANSLQRTFPPEIVRAAMLRYVDNQREANRIARERAALRRREAELNQRAARL